MKKILYILTIVTAFCLFACEHDNHLSSYESDIVVEGWIEAGGFPVVMVTRTFPVMEEEVELGNLYDYILRWAVVKISCEDDTVILTGKYDDRYFPPYIYTTGRMRGEVGKTYQLTIDYRDIHAEALATIPSVVPVLDSVITHPVVSNDTLRTLTACFITPHDTPNYYQLFVRQGFSSPQFLAAYLGGVDCHLQDGYREVVVRPSHQFKKKHYTPYFVVGDTVVVKLSIVDSQTYHFWREYDNLIAFSSNMMSPATNNLPSNISGGMGCWYGATVTTMNVVVK